jgi:hydrogenase expression/formation protein HypC
MCLGLVCRAAEVDSGVAVVQTADNRDLRVSLLTLDQPVRPGDWLLVHAGFALSRLTEEQAMEALALRGPTVEDGQ